MDKKYNIAIVGGSLSTYGGGAPRSMAQQATILTEMGHTVKFFVGRSRKYPLTVDQFSCKECRVHSSPLWGPSVLGFFPGALGSLWKHARSFDFIHLNGAWNLTTFIGATIARMRGIPYIITMRGHLGAYHFRRMPLLKRILFQLFEKTNLRHAYAMHATAQWEVKTSHNALQHAQQIITIPNPVDLTDFKHPRKRNDARNALGLNEGDFHVVHLGRLAQQKNLPFLIQAFAEAALGKDAYLTFIGPPEPLLKKEMEQLVTRLDLGPQVRFINFAKGPDRCDWLAAADLFALPSFDENFCIVAVESIASGTHCLLSPHIGALEFLPTNLIEVLNLDRKKWTKSLQENYKNRPAQQIPSADALRPLSSELIGKKWQAFYAKSH